MITFEYILIKGVNDRKQDAENLVRLLKGIRAKVNLIALNPGPGCEMSAPCMDEVMDFQESLVRNHLTVIIRKSRGQDIQAACGQLRAD
jgi:23S rRNA (adenine2503-C2)-methyltransferase